MGSRRIVWLAGLFLTGCGDELLCPQQSLIVIQSPQGTVAGDADATEPGVQVDVDVRSTLVPGSTLALLARDAADVQVATANATVDGAGAALFAGVTLPNGPITLEVTAVGACPATSGLVTVDVVAGLGCVMSLSVQPVANDFYDPLSVLNRGLDPVPLTTDFDLGVAVTTAPAWEVEVFRTAGGTETSVATTTATDTGMAGFLLLIPQGEIGLRAECRGPGGAAAASLSSRFYVDTVAPTCALAAPVPGSTITPSYDLDSNLANGVQLALDGAIGGGDVEGEAATFTITVAGAGPVEVAGTAIAGDGRTTATGTVDPPTTPSSVDLAVRAIDHADNTCSATGNYPIVYDGCDITVVAPTGPIGVDADGVPGNGAQLDVTLQIADECVGRTVSSDCGLDPPSGVVPAGGSLTLRVDMCATAACEIVEACGFSVTTIAGVQTQANVNLEFDNIGPDVTVAVVAPSVSCGAQVTPSADQDPGTGGVQVGVRVTAAAATAHRVEITNASGTLTLPAPADVLVTLAAGANQLRGFADDALGNIGTSPVCSIALADLAVSFAPPAADGTVTAADGTVTGSNLTFALCGTVSTTGATVGISIDGGAALPAIVTGTSWCRTITVAESPPTHTIVATASKPPSFGEATLVLTVDITPPGAITDLAAIALDRQRIHLSWTAPGDAGLPVDHYLVKRSTTALTDANFDTTGTIMPTGAPANPGQPEQLELFPARTGTTVWFGAVTVDANGNRSVAAIAGPVKPDFTHSGAITMGNAAAGNQGIGWAIASGRFNDDDLVDVAIGAPGEGVGATAAAGVVSVFFGTPSGIASTPGLVIQGTTTNGRLGTGLTAVGWTVANREDLVIGAPGDGGGNGAVYVFTGGAGLGTGTVSAATADITINVAAAPGWFAGGRLGTTLAVGRIDDDAIDDLVIAAPLGGGGTQGGIAMVYGGTATASTIGLSDVDPGAANGAVITLIQDPAGATGRQFGYYAHVVGKTMGAADVTDDVLVGYIDDTTTSEAAYLFRPDGTRPATAGVTAGGFVVGRDVRIELVTTSTTAEFAAQATTIPDQNGDGARDLVVSAHRVSSGNTLIIDGNTLGTAGIAQTSTAGVVLTTILGGAGVSKFGAAIAGHGVGAVPDVDGDGPEDLLVAGVTGGTGRFYVFFGGTIPTGLTSAAAAGHAVPAPNLFVFAFPVGGRGAAAQARWLGDVDGDGLDDVCWSAPNDNSRDGAFEVMY